MKKRNKRKRNKGWKPKKKIKEKEEGKASGQSVDNQAGGRRLD